MNTVLVTGAAGLIGSALVTKLLDKNIKTIACDNFTIGEWKINHDKLIWEADDINSSNFISRLDQYNIDCVVHCAAHPGGKSLNEPSLNVEVNLLGSMRLFEWCANNNTPVIYISSSVIYSDQPNVPISENAKVDPGTIYGVCKISCENFLKILGEGYSLPWTIIRLFATYGPGHKPSKSQGIVNIMLTQLLEGNKIIVKGSMQRSRDMLFVDDAADAILQAVFSEKSRGEIINVGTGDPITIESLIRTLCKILGKKYDELIIQEEEGTIGDPFYNSADCSKAENFLGFNAKYDLEAGLNLLVKKRIK